MPGHATRPGSPPCKICGLPIDGRGQLFADWVPASATDWSCWQGPPSEPGAKGKPGGYVCEPCAWVRSGKPSTAVPWAPDAALTTSLRLYSHIWDEVNGWRWATLSGKRFLLDEFWRTLRCPPGTHFFAAFSDASAAARSTASPRRSCGTSSRANNIRLPFR